jgi:hypothetical protein
MKAIDRILQMITIASFVGTIVSWATSQRTALVVTTAILAISVCYAIFRFLSRRISLKGHNEYTPLEKFLANASGVDIIGINLAGIVSGFQGFIEERAGAGCEFRFIITDPARMNMIPMSMQTRRNTQNTFDLK